MTNIAKVLRKAGLTVVTNNKAELFLDGAECANVKVIKNCEIDLQVFSILGEGCINHPRHDEVLNELKNKVMVALVNEGVDFHFNPIDPNLIYAQR